MGRPMRSGDPQAVVRWIRDAGDRHGISSLFIVDDDFFRSPTWEPILEGMAAYRRDGHDLSFMMQVDAEAAAFGDLRPGEPPSSQRRKCERFLELAAAAGCYSAFVGFETFNPQNLLAAAKVQNLEKEQRRRKDEASDRALAAVKEKYRRVVHNWHRHGVAVHCGYMIGFPFDGPECGRQSAEWLLEVGVDLASFFIVTPLPGTEDHDKALREGTILDWDFNNYDSQHMVSHHPRMTTAQVVQAYRDAYLTFSSPPSSRPWPRRPRAGRSAPSPCSSSSAAAPRSGSSSSSPDRIVAGSIRTSSGGASGHRPGRCGAPRAGSARRACACAIASRTAP